jgi:hypothetical protein
VIFCPCGTNSLPQAQVAPAPGRLEQQIRTQPRWAAACGALADRYEHLFTPSRRILLIDLSRDQLRAEAQLRAMTGPKTPAALQLAAYVT